MTPMPDKPVIVVELNDDNQVVSFSSNISPNLKVIVTHNTDNFIDESMNKPFILLNPTKEFVKDRW